MKNLVFLLASLILFGCYSERKNTPTRGSLTVYVDESVYPLLKDEVTTFEKDYPKAKIELKSIVTNGGMEKILNGETKMFISTRDFNKKESAFITENKLNILAFKFVYDAVAVITSKSQKLDFISISDLKDILDGNNKKFTAVIPNSNTGTYYTIRKDLLGSKNPTNVEYVLDEKSVKEKVMHNPNTIGFESINLIQDSSHIKILKVGDLKVRNGEIAYYTPHPAYTYKDYYPLRRTVYIFLSEIGQGLGSGFTTFLTSDDGQKVALKNNIAPAAVPVVVH